MEKELIAEMDSFVIVMLANNGNWTDEEITEYCELKGIYAEQVIKE